METVLSGRQVVVKDPAAGARVLPLMISAVELIPESDFLRNGKAQCRVTDFDITTPRGEAKGTVDGVVLPVGLQFLNIDRRRDGISPHRARVHGLNDRVIQEPQPAGGRPGSSRLKC